MTFNFSHLPQELLVDIFKHLSAADLLALSATCRAFNNAINSCSDLMRKFTVFINDSRKHLDWQPARTYSNVFVSCDNLGDFLHIFDDIGDDLRVLHMSYCKVDASDVIKILKSCNKIKELHFRAVDMAAKTDDFDAELPELVLDKFSILNLKSTTELVFQILQKSSVIDINMLGEFRHPQLLKNFLKTQTKLESFKIHNQCDEFMLFDDDLLSDVEFRLRELKLNNWDMYNQLTPFLRNFIEKQKDTIEVRI
jgi:hypothetical protein